MGTVYSRVFSQRTGWVLGRIVNHVAEPISDPDELDAVCDQLNAARQDAKVWVVEVMYNGGDWRPATDASRVLAFNNFYSAHKAKRAHYHYLKSVAPKVWTRKHVRVRLWNAPAE